MAGTENKGRAAFPLFTKQAIRPLLKQDTLLSVSAICTAHLVQKVSFFRGMLLNANLDGNTVLSAAMDLHRNLGLKFI